MGREFDDPSIQEDIKHFPFSVFRKDDKPVIRVRTSSVNKFFTPEEISAMILGKMREIAVSSHYHYVR
jgi:molecular chaperone DnaK (HSP70)